MIFLFPARHVKRVVDPVQRAIVAPAVEVVIQRALRRQILRHIAPLAASAEHIHDPIRHIANRHFAAAAAALCSGNQGFNLGPLGVGQITGVPTLGAVIAGRFSGVHMVRSCGWQGHRISLIQ